MSTHIFKKFFNLRQLQTSEHTVMALLAVAVGLAGGFGAVGFRYLINFFQTLAYGADSDLLELVQTIPWYYRLCIPALGGLIVGPLVYFLAREAKGHGVPEVMEAVALKGGVIRKRVVVVKSLASAISISTGGSVGREGPIVQIGSAIGSVLGQVMKVSADRMRTLVGCGAAAGIAATFNAPIAGSMFALEVILGDFGLATFSPIVIASVVATAVSRAFLGDTPAFIVPAYELVSAWELPLYLVLGLFCAVVGVTFTQTLYRIEDVFDNFKFPEYLKGTIGGLILGAVALLFPHILGVGYGAGFGAGQNFGHFGHHWVGRLRWNFCPIAFFGGHGRRVFRRGDSPFVAERYGISRRIQHCGHGGRGQRHNPWTAGRYFNFVRNDRQL
jgi:CIC family chloride channel protein